jgi:hypothetical protein
MHAPEKEYCKVNAESHGAPTLLRPFASAGVEEKFKLPDPLKSWRGRNSILAEAPHFFPCCCFRTYEGINVIRALQASISLGDYLELHLGVMVVVRSKTMQLK